jgi:hypothetical protein
LGGSGAGARAPRPPVCESGTPPGGSRAGARAPRPSARESGVPFRGSGAGARAPRPPVCEPGIPLGGAGAWAPRPASASLGAPWGRSSSTVDIRARCLHSQILIWVPPLKLFVSSIHVFQTEVPGYGLWSWGPMVQRTPTGTMKDADSGGVAVIKIAHEIPKGPAPKHEEKS